MALVAKQITKLRATLSGGIVTTEDFAYEALRRTQIFGPRTDKRPLLVAECASTGDIIQCLEFAQNLELPVSIRGGGHNFAGFSANAGGLLLDLRRLRRVDVDTQQKVATMGAGALTLEVAALAGVHGLVPVLAQCPMVGVAGLALGGGLSLLSGRYGATCDTVKAIEIVTANSQVLTTSAGSYPDLFWALRGGGGNFGVVTSITMDLFSLPQTTTAELLYKVADARRMMSFYREYMRGAPDELQGLARVSNIGGALSLMLRLYWSGDGEGSTVLDPFRKAVKPMRETIHTGPFVDTYRSFNVAQGSNFSAINGAYIAELSDSAIDKVIERIEKAGDWGPASIGLDHYMHGQASRVPIGETAFDVRDPGGLFVWISSAWNDARFNNDVHNWLDASWTELRKFARRRAYANYPSLAEPPAAADAYPESLERLRTIKKQFDPTNMFRSNLNIKPN